MAGMITEMKNDKHMTVSTAQNTRQFSMNCSCASSRCATFVVVVIQQPAKQLMADDLVHVELAGWCRWWQFGVDRCIAKRLMGTEFVVVGQPLCENISQVRLTKDDEMVQDLCAYSTHPGLSDRIQIWRSWRNGPELDAVEFEDRTELRSELGVTIANDVSGSKVSFFLSEDDAHVPSHLRHPRTVGIGRHANNMNATRVQMDEKQHIIGNLPTQRPDTLHRDHG